MCFERELFERVLRESCLERCFEHVVHSWSYMVQHELASYTFFWRDNTAVVRVLEVVGPWAGAHGTRGHGPGPWPMGHGTMGPWAMGPWAHGTLGHGTWAMGPGLHGKLFDAAVLAQERT
jgi:hypothetical protein